MYGSPPSENVLGAINESATKYVDAVCSELDIEVSEVISHNRNRLICDLRHLIMYVLRNEFDMTFSEVGSFLHRDHATAIHERKKFRTYSKPIKPPFSSVNASRPRNTFTIYNGGKILNPFQNGSRQKNLCKNQSR